MFADFAAVNPSSVGLAPALVASNSHQGMAGRRARPQVTIEGFKLSPFGGHGVGFLHPLPSSILGCSPHAVAGGSYAVFGSGAVDALSRGA